MTYPGGHFRNVNNWSTRERIKKKEFWIYGRRTSACAVLPPLPPSSRAPPHWPPEHDICSTNHHSPVKSASDTLQPYVWLLVRYGHVVILSQVSQHNNNNNGIICIGTHCTPLSGLSSTPAAHSWRSKRSLSTFRFSFRSKAIHESPERYYVGTNANEVNANMTRLLKHIHIIIHIAFSLHSQKSPVHHASTEPLVPSWYRSAVEKVIYGAPMRRERGRTWPGFHTTHPFIKTTLPNPTKRPAADEPTLTYIIHI